MKQPGGIFHVVAAVAFALWPASAFGQTPGRTLLTPAKLIAPPVHVTAGAWRPVRLDEEALDAALTKGSSVEIELFAGSNVRFQLEKSIGNPSGSRSWIGDLRGQEGDGLAVIVTRDGVAVGSIRVGGDLYLLSYGGEVAEGEHVHVLHEVDESAPWYRESPPTPVQLDPAKLESAKREALRRAKGMAPQDDGSLHDLLVVYTQRAMDEVGGQTAIENLIDLGVTETNMSYETSGVHHRLRLVGTALTDYDEQNTPGDPRDFLQNPSDGVMDEVHALRDQVAADLVKLIGSTGGCGRAFIMTDISLAFEEFAFCWTSHVCVSPGYTFQHELGHIQTGRHQRTSPDPGSPFPYNFGFTDPVNQFRTIMAAGSSECPDGCPRRLAWSNPDVLDAETGEPMGNPETHPLPTDMRQALNAVSWTVANFRVSNPVLEPVIFIDGFESGNTDAWVPGEGSDPL